MNNSAKVPCPVRIALGWFVLAILRGKLDWMTIPCLLIGLLAFFVPLAGSFRSEFTLGLTVYLIVVAFVTIVPPALLCFPSSSRWFATFPRQKGLGVGCGTLIVLVFVGMMAPVIDVVGEMKAGLILEGGASRGLFTAVALDVFMENGISFESGGE